MTIGPKKINKQTNRIQNVNKIYYICIHTLNHMVAMALALVSTNTMPLRISLTGTSMAKAADWVALTSLQAVRFRLIEVTMTGRNVPSSNGPRFKVMPSVMIP